MGFQPKSPGWTPSLYFVMTFSSTRGGWNNFFFWGGGAMVAFYLVVVQVHISYASMWFDQLYILKSHLISFTWRLYKSFSCFFLLFLYLLLELSVHKPTTGNQRSKQITRIYQGSYRHSSDNAMTTKICNHPMIGTLGNRRAAIGLISIGPGWDSYGPLVTKTSWI